MARWKVFYYNVRDPHRLLHENVECLTVFGVYKRFMANARTRGDIYLSCIKVKMPKVNGGKK